MASALMHQLFVLSGVFITIMGFGYSIGITAVVIPILKKPDSPIPLDTNTASWFTAMIAAMILPGHLIAAAIMKRFGRRWAMLAAIVPNILGFTLLFWGENLTVLICGRVFQGLSFGSGISTSGLVTSEISSPNNRSGFLNFLHIAIHLGYVIAHSLGLFFEWRTVAILGTILPSIALIMVWFWPESPIWLVTTGRFKKCEKSFYWLRGHGQKQNEELADMLETQKLKRQLQNSDNKTSILTKLRNPKIIKPTLLVIFAYNFLETCGRHVLPSYVVDIISSFTGDKTNAFYYSLSIDTLIMISIACSCVLAKYFKRRFLVFLTGAFALFFLLTFCLILYLKDLDIISREMFWLPILLFALYFISLNLGVAVILSPVFGEVFPLDTKEIGVVINGTAKAFYTMITLKLTPVLLEYIDLHGTMFVYAICMGTSLIYLWFYLPETKGKTLLEIERGFEMKIVTQDELVKKDILLRSDNNL